MTSPHYVLGVIVVGAYMGALALAALYAFGESIMHDQAELIIFSCVTVFFWLVVGHSWFAD